jgi:threonine aldolase
MVSISSDVFSRRAKVSPSAKGSEGTIATSFDSASVSFVSSGVFARLTVSISVFAKSGSGIFDEVTGSSAVVVLVSGTASDSLVVVSEAVAAVMFSEVTVSDTALISSS